MDISFSPSSDVAVILNALLDKFENRAKHNPALSAGMQHEPRNPQPCLEQSQRDPPRSIKILLTDLHLPTYFSQTDPEPRLIANKELQELARHDLITLKWLPGETNHLLHSITLPTGHPSLYALLQRTPLANQRAHLESLLLAEKFRFQKDDWRARALDYILDQLRAGKSPSPFSLTDPDLNLDLLTVLQALSTLKAETPYRVFSVRVLNDSKRLEALKPALVRLARCANAEWKALNREDILRELNLVANPNYIHMAGNWELIDNNGQIINLDSFTPSVGFPASHISFIQRIRAESVLCIENLTSFHEFLRANAMGSTQRTSRNIQHATLCLMGNPSPSIRHLLRLVDKETPIYLWSDLDYGGFNILSQLRRQVSLRIQPFLMDIATFDAYAHLSRPLTQSDARHLKRLTLNSHLKDIRPTIEHLLKRGLKLEQEAISI